MRFWILGVIGLSALWSGCSADETGDGGPGCVDTICAAGEKACFGNNAATCDAEGTAWETNFCGATNRCEAGGCVARECAFPGQSKCSDYKTLSVCSADGRTQTQQPCEGGTTCVAGACRSVTCAVGETGCGFRKVAECSENGGWKEIACDPDQICVDGACAAQVCVPERIECSEDGTIAKRCRQDGSGWDQTACAADQACYAGACFAKLCVEPGLEADAGSLGDAEDSEVTAEDAVEAPDEGPKPGLEPLDKAEVVVDGQKIVFSSHKAASLVESKQDLRITMDKGQIKLEISIVPIEEFDVASFSSTKQSDTNVQILYHDGSELVGDAQFRYVSVDYELELVKFQAVGGRVKGTFSGTFTDDGGATTIAFTNGVFDVKRHD